MQLLCGAENVGDMELVTLQWLYYPHLHSSAETLQKYRLQNDAVESFK